MLILTIRTDKPEAEIALYIDHQSLDQISWLAHRELSRTIHDQIKELLGRQKRQWKDINGVAVYQGPGSFTGLRIGISVANALSYSLDVPIVASSGPNWLEDGIEGLLKGRNDVAVLPEYGAPVHTTEQKH